MRLYRVTLFLLILLTLAACRDRGRTPDEVPTIAAPDQMATAIVMTRNAPPPGFRETVSFPVIDENVVHLPSWTYELTVEFNGQFAGTGRLVSGSTRVEGAYRQVGQRRRIVVRRDGELVETDGSDVAIEGVRIAQDVYRVRDNVCTGVVEDEGAALADLRVADLVGGVVNAAPASGQERINAEVVWKYSFGVEDLVLAPVVEFGTVNSLAGELWVAPEYNIVIRYYVNMDVGNAIVFNSDAPVSGQLIIRYDLLNIGADPNITRPFGC